MAYSDYESELYPVGPDKQDFDWWKAELLCLPTDDLKEKYKEYSEYLERLRRREPAKKRGKKSDYRSWIKLTHDYIDLLNDIAAELNSIL